MTNDSHQLYLWVQVRDLPSRSSASSAWTGPGLSTRPTRPPTCFDDAFDASGLLATAPAPAAPGRRTRRRSPGRAVGLRPHPSSATESLFLLRVQQGDHQHHEQAPHRTWSSSLARGSTWSPARSAGSARVAPVLHLGGGSPTFLSDDESRSCDSAPRCSFFLRPERRDLHRGRPAPGLGRSWRSARAAGFNRLQLHAGLRPHGVKAVNRIQSFERVRGDAREPVALARLRVDQRLLPDLILGLPAAGRPSPCLRAGRSCTGRRAAARHASRCTPTPTCPERFRGSSLPHRHRVAVPCCGSSGTLAAAMASFTGRGYATTSAWIISHCPTIRSPSLWREGRHQRNHQGVQHASGCDLSRAGRLRDRPHRQEAYRTQKTYTGAYYAALDAGRFPVARGRPLVRCTSTSSATSIGHGADVPRPGRVR